MRSDLRPGCQQLEYRARLPALTALRDRRRHPRRMIRR